MTTTTARHSRYRRSGQFLDDLQDWGYLPQVPVERYYTPAEMVSKADVFLDTATVANTVTPLAAHLRVGAQSQSSGVFDGYLIPETLSVGDEWALAVSTHNNQSTAGGLSMAGLRVSAGVTGTDAAFNLVNQGSGACFGRHGTVASATSVTGAVSGDDGRTPLLVRVRYSATDTFHLSASSDLGVTWHTEVQLSITLTPTHIGPTWSTYGNAGSVFAMRFGYLAKLIP